MARTILLSVLGLAIAACSSEAPQPQHPYWAPQPQPQPQAAPKNYSMPWAIPIPPVLLQPASATPSASATPPPAAAPAEIATCLADAGTAADCKTALDKIGQTGAGKDKVRDVYQKACTKKAKLLGCGAFKSTAIGEGDKPAMDLLMLCEAGQSEACEDVKTKTAPLMAWLSTLKTDGCKRGAMALCASFKECKKSTPWGCQAVSGGPADAQVCGCVPKCDKGVVATKASDRPWPDGSKRGAFTCAP
jgi:hypothetical protein